MWSASLKRKSGDEKRETPEQVSPCTLIISQEEGFAKTMENVPESFKKVQDVTTLRKMFRAYRRPRIRRMLEDKWTRYYKKFREDNYAHLVKGEYRW